MNGLIAIGLVAVAVWAALTKGEELVRKVLVRCRSV